MIEFILGVIIIFILFLFVLFGMFILAGAMIDYIYNDDIDEDGSMAELVDASGLSPDVQKWACEFESHWSYK